ncbi:hypothetical protein BKA70DRAFT_459416 [Coprinopsis sp. MPI-PUGE-AT-0042]|nr:hypothetical protein BKA70DRAFT_459416 [Coprinopsis sp. MPI-PUGE-AT-0042]
MATPWRFSFFSRLWIRASHCVALTLLLFLMYGAFCTPFFDRISEYPLFTKSTSNISNAPSALVTSAPPSLQEIPEPLSGANKSATLGIADKIYVVSLPTREDRRSDMEYLRSQLGLRWTYFYGTFSRDPIIAAIYSWVRRIRRGPPVVVDAEGDQSSLGELDGSAPAVHFTWPDGIHERAVSFDPLPLRHAGIWPDIDLEPNFNSGIVASEAEEVVPCASRNYVIPSTNATREQSFPKHKILTLGRIACWHSHWSLIHAIANDKSSNTSIILEDDIDMERDTKEQLEHLWKYLPSSWDIVFLGHCWSNESYYPPMSKPLTPFMWALHPSRAPKCTHAYALSREGARRILLHFQYPPFAYSRGIDQAFAWLIESGRIKSFSVVPSIVVQRKISSSDIEAGTGSTWKDTLVHGVFDASY